MNPSPVWAVGDAGSALTLSDADGVVIPAGGWEAVRQACTVTTNFDSTGGDLDWTTNHSYSGMYLVAVDEAGIVRWLRHDSMWHPDVSSSGILTVTSDEVPAGTFRFLPSTIALPLGSRLADADATYAETAYFGFDHVIDACPQGLTDADGRLREGVTGTYRTTRAMTRSFPSDGNPAWVTFPLVEDSYIAARGSWLF